MAFGKSHISEKRYFYYDNNLTFFLYQNIKCDFLTGLFPVKFNKIRPMA